MINLKDWEKNANEIQDNLAKRNFVFDIEKMFGIKNNLKDLMLKIEKLNQERKSNKDVVRGKEIKQQIEELNVLLNDIQKLWETC